MSDRLSVRAGAALLVIGFLGLVWLDLANDTLRANVVPSTIAWFLVAGAGYLLLLRLQFPLVHGDWKWLVAVGLGLRLLLLITEPTLSDDVYRYLWEGHLVTEGVSPYRFPIDSVRGDIYTIPARDLANNTSLASPYLPVAHAIFGATATVLPSQAWTMQLLMIGFDALGGLMIMRLLRAVGLPERRVLIYWLNPLVIVEVAHGAHIDAIIVGVGFLGLWLSLDKASSSPIAAYAGPMVLAAATLTRPLVVLFAPVLFWLWNVRQRVVFGLATAVPILVVGLTVSFGLGDADGTGVFGSARAYTDSFRFNSGIYHWAERWIGSQGLDDKGWNEPVALTRLIMALAVGLLLLAVFVHARKQRSTLATMRLLAVPLMIYVVFTPVLHPWYTLLLLAFVPFLAPGEHEAAGRWLTAAPWLVLSLLLIFSYLTYENPAAFAEREWVRRIEWYPTLALVVIAAGWLAYRRSRHMDLR